jgi:exopolysaccharide biosynthesis predicted pyruvyltransferase EpsI
MLRLRRQPHGSGSQQHNRPLCFCHNVGTIKTLLSGLVLFLLIFHFWQLFVMMHRFEKSNDQHRRRHPSSARAVVLQDWKSSHLHHPNHNLRNVSISNEEEDISINKGNNNNNNTLLETLEHDEWSSPIDNPVLDDDHLYSRPNRGIVVEEEKVKPWESAPPRPIPLDLQNSNHRHQCIQAIRNRHTTLLAELFPTHSHHPPRLLLVDPAYHSNVGDHMLTLGELVFIKNTLYHSTNKKNQDDDPTQQGLPSQCHYIQAGGFYPSCTEVITTTTNNQQQEQGPNNKKDHHHSNSPNNYDYDCYEYAMWHAGGNWGDLWRDAQTVRIPSFRTLLEFNYTVVSMPQSLYHTSVELQQQDATWLKEMVALGLGLAVEEEQVDEEQEQEVRARHNDKDDDKSDNPNENPVDVESNDDFQDGSSGAGRVGRFQPQSSDNERLADWNALPQRTTTVINTMLLDTPAGRALAHSKVILTWRERESYELALQLYPYVRNLLVPDIAFQLGPYAPIRRKNKNHHRLAAAVAATDAASQNYHYRSSSAAPVDILIFLRADHESKINTQQRNNDYIQRTLNQLQHQRQSSSVTQQHESPPPAYTFRIVDWPDRLDLFEPHQDIFFTKTAIELLSLGKVVVCDRLHAAILSYLVGLPFVYIDQVSGKITKTLSVAFQKDSGNATTIVDSANIRLNCMDGDAGQWAKETSLDGGLAKAVEFIDKYEL